MVFRRYHIYLVRLILFFRLSGRPPFESEDEDEMFKDIITNQVEFPINCWKYVSTSAKDFVSKLL